MNNLFSSLSVFCLSVIILDSTGHSCKILLDPDFKGSVKLYSTEHKKGIVKTINHDFKKEDFIYFKVLKTNDSMFYVSANYSFKGYIADGWIDKNNSKLGIYSRVYSDSDSLILYSFPNKSKKSAVIKRYISSLIRVVDCKGDWLKVIVHIDKKNYQGWMPPEEQCANSYTTCN
jgi:hypothetical protein